MKKGVLAKLSLETQEPDKEETASALAGKVVVFTQDFSKCHYRPHKKQQSFIESQKVFKPWVG